MRFRKDRMSPQERLQALFTYKTPDRVPLACIDAGFSSINAGYSIATAYGDPEDSFRAMLWAEEQYGFDPPPQIIRHTILAAHDFGGKVRLPSGDYEGAMMIESTPVHSEIDAINLKMPDPRTAGGIEFAMRFSKLQASRGLSVWFHHRSPFTMASNICGIELFARWMYRKPELCHLLIRRSIKHIFNVLEYWIESFGTENIVVYNSSPSEANQLISPKHFEIFAVPYHIEYINKLKSLGINKYFFHICGDQNGNLPLLSQIATWPHPSILSFGHEVDIAKAAALFPGDIIYGNVDPTIIQMDTPENIYNHCSDIIKKGMKSSPGYILAPGCDIPVGAPPVNVFAMAKAINDFGWYI